MNTSGQYSFGGDDPKGICPGFFFKPTTQFWYQEGIVYSQCSQHKYLKAHEDTICCYNFLICRIKQKLQLITIVLLFKMSSK